MNEEGSDNSRRWQAERIGVWAIALAALAVGLLDVAQGISGHISDRPQLLFLNFNSHWSKSLIVACGLTLIYLAVNLGRRKRIAWILALGTSILSLASHLVHHDFGPGLWAVGIFAGLLIMLRHHFPVKSEPTSIASGMMLSALTLSVALLYGVAGFWFMDRRDFGIDFNLIDALLRTLREFALVGNADLTPHTHHATWFLHSLDLAGATTGLLVAHSLFRPLAYEFDTKPNDLRAATDIVKKDGRSALDFYKLMPEKSYYFSPSRKSFIAYRVERDVVVCLGDPVGPLDDFNDTVSSFLKWVTENGWLICFLQAEPATISHFKALGFTAIKIGEEARIDLAKFCTTTIKKKDFKGKENKFKGYTFERHDPPHSAELMTAVEDVSNAWLSLPGRGEHSFTLGRFERGYISTTPLFTIKDPNNAIIAFVNEVPSYYPGEVSIDLMRHKEEVPSGTMDYLFLKLLQYYQGHEYKYFNLGLAALAGVGETPDASFQERALHQLFEHLNRFFSYKGLRKYKQKFDPIWENQYFVYRGGPAALLRCVISFKRVTGY